MQKKLNFAILSKRCIVAVLALGIMTTTTALRFTAPLVSASTMPSNQTSSESSGSNMTFVGNMTDGKNMTMPGGNMTFGTSLQNAKMHLMEAIMELKTGNTKGTMMELNLTDQGIKMHEQELKSMMMDVKSMMTKMKETSNMTSSSSSSMSKKATS